MLAITLQAYFDGEHIVLDEYIDLPRDVPLMVTVLPLDVKDEPDSEEAWMRAVSSSDAFAFLADPAEDVYTLEDGEPFDDAP